MNKKTTILILGVIVIIIAIILFDFLGNQPGKRGGNPYEYDIESFKTVDSALIHYKEIKNIAIDNQQPMGFDIFDDILYITGDKFLQAVNQKGKQIFSKSIESSGTCIEVNEEFIFIGFGNFIGQFDKDGVFIRNWKRLDDNSVITSLSSKGKTLFAADAGNRRVLIYNAEGFLSGEFTGKSESAAGHGFIVPSPSFDLVVNSYGDLWVVNPGEHAIENYNDEGVMRGFWKKTTMDIDGFIGCCNPAHISVLADGSFLTSEKGMVRIKIYDESGKLLSVVAPPSKFNNPGRAPEVAVDNEGLIYAMDFDRKMIRIFKKNKL